jgi:hypothetical protein
VPGPYFYWFGQLERFYDISKCHPQSKLNHIGISAHFSRSNRQITSTAEFQKYFLLNVNELSGNPYLVRQPFRSLEKIKSPFQNGAENQLHSGLSKADETFRINPWE